MQILSGSSTSDLKWLRWFVKGYSKYKRDLKRLSNGHKEYGNVMKKNKLKSQKTNLDLR